MIQDMNIDAVVMLTLSNWFTELRSNRYHYATRFAALYPVIFVQADLNKDRYYFEETGIDNLSVLHVPMHYGPKQTKLLAAALNERGIISPLLWVYNPEFIDFINTAYAPYKVYHATEDYFAKDYCHSLHEKDYFIQSLRKLLAVVDEVICVSLGVQNSLLLQDTKLQHKIRTITNGCDYAFYKKDPIDKALTTERNSKRVFYHGNIFGRLDFALLQEVVKALPQWEFIFAGPILPKNNQEWLALAQNPNVSYLGVLTPEQIRAEAHQATVGIIPFKQELKFLQGSFPLKAFEYIACGLPVVSTPIDALKTFGDLFLFATDCKSLVTQIQRAYERQHSSDFHERAQKIASEQSYDNKFQEVIQGISARKHIPTKKLNLLLCYEASSLPISAVRDHLQSFSQFSIHHISLFSDTLKSQAIDLTRFDAVILHYSLRLSLASGPLTVSPKLRKALKSYPGLKIAFMQDEYDTTNTTIHWLRDLGVQVAFTCVPDAYVHQVYSKEQLPHVRFYNNLTGYVPDWLVHYPVKPTAQRPLAIAYRGRNLPYWYGSLGQEKERIGQVVKAACQKLGIPEDIEWDTAQRIYGDAWHQFLSSAKATLGTESGCNIFDFDGNLSRDIQAYLAQHPKASYEEVAAAFLKDKEHLVHMNQVSPKIFEAICLHTALILFEGSYSNILEADTHYIPLKKDFSNLTEVLTKARDDDYLTNMVNKAYEDIILSGRYSYLSFIQYVDGVISSHSGNKYQALPAKPVTLLRYSVNSLKALLRFLLFGKLLTPIKIFVQQFDFIHSRLHKIKYRLYE